MQTKPAAFPIRLKFLDDDLGNSSGWLAVTVASFWPSKAMQKQTKSSPRADGKRRRPIGNPFAYKVTLVVEYLGCVDLD